MAESAQALNWLYTTLHADSALLTAAPGDVWRDFAPTGTTAPYVVISVLSSPDIITMNAKRIFSTINTLVKVIGPGNGYAALVTAFNRIDALIGRVGPVALSVGGVLACYREQEIAYGQIVAGALWNHLGGLFRIELQGS